MKGKNSDDFMHVLFLKVKIKPNLHVSLQKFQINAVASLKNNLISENGRHRTVVILIYIQHCECQEQC